MVRQLPGFRIDEGEDLRGLCDDGDDDDDDVYDLWLSAFNMPSKRHLRLLM